MKNMKSSTTFSIVEKALERTLMIIRDTLTIFPTLRLPSKALFSGVHIDFMLKHKLMLI